MKRLVLGCVALCLLFLPASAAASIHPLSPNDGSALTAAQALIDGEGSAGPFIGASLPEAAFGPSSAQTPLGIGDDVAPAPQSLTGFPTAGNAYAILSTGAIGTIASQFSSSTFGSTEFPSQTSSGPNVHGAAARDWTVMKVDVDAPSDTNCIEVDFRFLSEEYPQFIGQQYNDAFIAEIDSNSWAVKTGGELVRPNDFAASPLGAPISVNGVGPTEMTAAEAQGTYFNAATALLTARSAIEPGQHSIYFSIFDASDKKYDSAVLLDNLRFVEREPVTCQPIISLPSFPLQVSLEGDGSGEVTSSPAGIECGTDCEVEYEEGQVVVLTATPTRVRNSVVGRVRDAREPVPAK